MTMLIIISALELVQQSNIKYFSSIIIQCFHTIQIQTVTRMLQCCNVKVIDCLDCDC